MNMEDRAVSDSWVDDVLNFWFNELTHEDWFRGDEKLDEKIRDRFLELYEQQKRSFRVDAANDPRTALAAVILFDQFSRNLYRRQSAAFGTDDLALGIARRALDKGFDAEMSMDEKPFIYMPFMHSEILADQERCVDLFRAQDNENSLKYAIEHRDIIARFGRFPHRNRALGRETTPDEQAFLEGHAGYGQ
jgi:uncharacterized protein (DUF924 family)